MVFTCSLPMHELSSLQDSLSNGAPALRVRWLSPPVANPLVLVVVVFLNSGFVVARRRNMSKILCSNCLSLPLPLSSKGRTREVRFFRTVGSTSSSSNCCHLLFRPCTVSSSTTPTWFGPSQ